MLSIARQSISAVPRRQLAGAALGVRSLVTIKATPAEEQAILVAQRKNRPSSPHLQIYQPQLTWILSSFHRITGVGLAAGFYAVTCTYAFTSLAGIPFDTATLVSVVAGLPVAAKVGLKAAASFPFAFHVANGVRHLVWDFGKELTLKGVYRTGYVVLGFTALVGTYLTFL
ncbi:succinate dehydrogenase cytochrome B subunit, mitochondrial precursor [Ogataea parapolymorpha DL-1]|uniref:Succinate dehydrogenase cytochrome B subunit, mitochondrial n=1 Tax=Ogataea parapolymorpha (strain ATCC 26012 / BCRC 20466 / JCM 22074 / NRRL Y-7560 / DL-1) TaxID=871575 RepID=W1QCT6_OGAPD|nr:succinate dehydrogenase cytochrome B subunit, mitochondrial precursor [Ogataea parapolymorpha DL-1]ESW97537.1 succinate dehydrogenase cytochrome B subunit, mitochondrial precursor [Ogataea parapolymorpha DL-1]